MKNFWEILLYNIAFVGAWHVVAFVLCVYGSPSWFDFRRKRYQMFKWEKNGKWYVKYLKIKLWKDLVPTHVGKQGFSKDHLDTCLLYTSCTSQQGTNAQNMSWMCLPYTAI